MVNSNDDFIGAYLTIGARQGLKLYGRFLEIFTAFIVSLAFGQMPSF